jgi:hypothetical protein
MIGFPFTTAGSRRVVSGAWTHIRVHALEPGYAFVKSG